MAYGDLAADNFSLIVTRPAEINIFDVFRDVCAGLEHQVLVCLFLILTFYTITKVVMPLSLQGLGAFRLALEPFYVWVSEFLEGLSLLSISYIIALLWFGDKLTSGFKTWTIVLLAFVILAVVPKFLEWWRGGRKSSTLEAIKGIKVRLEDEKG